MEKCPKCGTPLASDAPACPNCGRLVGSQRELSLIEGVLWGLGSAVVGVIVWVFLSIAFNAIPGCGYPGPHGWSCIVMDAWIVGAPLLCIAALVGGIRAARRGAPGMASLMIIPAIIVLAPTTACAVNYFLH